MICVLCDEFCSQTKVSFRQASNVIDTSPNLPVRKPFTVIDHQTVKRNTSTMRSARRLHAQYMHQLSARPIATKVATASTIAVAGDVAAQAIAPPPPTPPPPGTPWRPNERAAPPPPSAPPAWDARRTLALAVFGGAYSGVFQASLARVCGVFFNKFWVGRTAGDNTPPRVLEGSDCGRGERGWKARRRA